MRSLICKSSYHIFQEDEVPTETESFKKDRKKSSIKKSDSIGDFDRGFNSIFEDDEEVPIFGQKLSNKLSEPADKMSPEASAALAADKWRRKKARHVSFYGSVSDTGV